MAIDASIITNGIKPLEPIDPMAIQARVFGLRNLQQQNQALTLENQQRQKAISDEQTMNRIMQGAYGQSASQQPGFTGPTQPGQPPAGGGGGLPPGVTKGADGVFTLDPGYLTKAMAQAGIADKIPGTIEQLSKMNESMATLAKTRGEVAIQTRDALGALGATVDAAGATPAALHMAALLAIHNGVVTPAQVQPYLDRVDADPTQVSAITKELQAGSPKQTELNSGRVTADARAASAAKPTDASLAVAAVGGDANAQAALDKLKDQKSPPSIEQQLLTAVANGDKATADTITRTMQTAANAKKDPASAAMALQLRNLNVQEAQARLDALNDKNKPFDVTADLQTTMSGKKYVDLSAYSAGERDKARDAAATAGATPVSKEQASALQEIDNARLNQQTILNGILDKLPKDAAGRVTTGLGNKLSAYVQSDDYLAAMGSLRTAAIQTLRAAAGSKGLRINEAEIRLAVENDLPKITDTVGTAQQKFKNLMAQLDNAESSIVTRDRSALKPSTGAAGITVMAPNGKSYTFKSQADADAFKAKAGIK